MGKDVGRARYPDYKQSFYKKCDVYFTTDSDIDIAIVAYDFIGDPVEDVLMLMKIRRKLDSRIEPKAFRTIDFDPSNPFVREIINTGIEII